MGGWEYLSRLLRFEWGGGAELLVGSMLGSSCQLSAQTIPATLKRIERRHNRECTY